MDDDEKQRLARETLDRLAHLLDDENINSVEVRFDHPDSELAVAVIASNTQAVQQSTVAEIAGGLPYEVIQGGREVPHLGRPSDIPASLASDRAVRRIGQGGTQLLRSDGAWGTLTLALQGMTIELSKGGSILQRCHRDGPTIVSNAHVLQPNRTRVTNMGEEIGKTSCHFNLNLNPSADYGHADWTSGIDSRNYGRILDSSRPAGKRIVGWAPARVSMPVAIQGARSGWKRGAIAAMATIRLTGFSGLFECWRGTYVNDFGDSGSPVITANGNNWTWVGVHFASNGHFWSWNSLGSAYRDGIVMEPSGLNP